MQNYSINKTYSTVLLFLQDTYPDTSSRTLRMWLSQGRVLLNEKRILRSNLALQQGDLIQIRPRIKALNKSVQIIYEDASLLVLYKPNGMLSVATDFVKESLHKAVKEYCKKRNQQSYVVHRLDKETSGLILFCKQQKLHTALKKMFEKHDIQREYKGIVKGSMESTKGTWKSYLAETEGDFSVYSTSKEQGKLAITHYELSKTNKDYHLVNFSLETGKKNQIRVHCKEAGISLYGDKKYGNSKQGGKRLCLHAYKLSFIHPFSNKKMCFEVPLPDYFIQIMGI